MSQPVIQMINTQVARVKLNRPEVRNALDPATIASLTQI
ncbi:MAG: enoyl-CoA hydratase, partial [Candidatus Eremiobacteraeota bacterium]|nr:enoyl-CoA hydratase [Candidatus Eremiobacteraeota bacterium]